MENNIDDKIKTALQKLSSLNKEKEKYYMAKELIPGQKIEYMDFFGLALAQDSVRVAELELNILFAEKFPKQFLPNEVVRFGQEIEGLNIAIENWKQRKFPR